MATVFALAGGALLLIMAVGLALVLRLRGRTEKIIVCQFLATVSVGWLLLEAMGSPTSHLFDVALVFTLLAALTTIAFVRQHENEEESRDDDGC